MVGAPATVYQQQTGPPHRHFTGAEIDAANDTDLLELLAFLGYQVTKPGKVFNPAMTKGMVGIRLFAG